MTERGYDLEKDLKLLLNNPKYSDIEILCQDEKTLYGSRVILAARSEVFDRIFYNGMSDYEDRIPFPINSSGMKIILEYIYTGSTEALTRDNIFEAFHAADYFQLSILKDHIIRTVKNILENEEDHSPAELLSKAVDAMPSEDNILLSLLVEAVAIIPLNTIEFGRLSLAALQYLLSRTYGKEKPFATPEYEVFRYSVLMASKQVSNVAYQTLMERLPTLEQLENSNSIKVVNKSITDNQKIFKELEPLIEFIDLNRINGQILTDIIYPLEIIPHDIILNVYQQIVRFSNNTELRNTRGTRVEDNGKVIRL